MKKITSLFAVLAMLATLFVAVPVSAETTGYAGGDGKTAETAYEIATAEQLAYAASKVNDGTDNTKYFKLTADIDYGNEEWVPMGNGTNSFQGNFDGQGHVVKNLKITASCDYIGFFGLVANGGVVKNLGIDGMYLYIASGGNRPNTVGGFASYVQAATITDCYLKNSTVDCSALQTNNAIGIFAGLVRNSSTVKNCYVYKTTTRANASDINAGFAHQRIGGGSTFENCYVAEITSVWTRAMYSFGSDDLSSVTATNCWSTLEKAEKGTYNAGYVFGEYVADKDTLVGKFNGVPGFAVSAKVNDGYPCLTWELPEQLYADGDGTEESPYEIANATHLANAAKQINAGVDNKAYFVLTADIDYNGQEWVPMGTSTNYFQGSFDGQGHVVKNLKIDGDQDYAVNDAVGFFGYVGNNAAGTEIKNLGIEDFALSFKGIDGNSSEVRYAGGMAGYVHAYTTISNCYLKNSSVMYNANFNQYPELALGSFVGLVRNLQGAETNTTAPKFENCYVYDVELRTANNVKVGGFAGDMYTAQAGKFINCYVAGVTYNTNFIYNSGPRATVYGFLDNENLAGIEVNNCYSTVTSQKGTTSTPATYTEARDAGNTGASQDAIVNAFEGVTGFAVSPAVNGGYPCFASEVPFKVTSVDSSNGTVKIARKAGVTTPATVYVATYDAYDRLVDVKASAVNADDFTFTPAGLTLSSTLKVFVWGENNNPLTYVD